MNEKSSDEISEYLEKCMEKLDSEIMPLVRQLIEEPTLTVDLYDLNQLIYTICNPDTMTSCMELCTKIIAGFHKLITSINKYCENYLIVKSNELKSIKNPYDFITDFNRFTKKFFYRLQKLHATLKPLESFFLQYEYGFIEWMNIEWIAKNVWIREMILDSNLNVSMVMFDLVNEERKSSNTTYEKLLRTTSMLIYDFDIDYFNGDFKNQFFNKSLSYYVDEAKNQFRNKTFEEYVCWAKQTIKNEMVRVKEYFPRYDEQYEKRFKSDLNEQVIFQFRDRLFESFRQLIRFSDVTNEDLKIFYCFVRHDDNNCNKMAEMYDEVLTNRIQELQSEDFVEKMGMLIGKQLMIIETFFKNSELFLNCFRKNIVKICEADDVIPKLLKYCDNLMAKTYDESKFLNSCVSIANIIRYSIGHEEFVKGFLHSITQRIFMSYFNVSNEGILIEQLGLVLMPAVSYRITRLLPDLRNSLFICNDFEIDSKTVPIKLHVLGQEYWPIKTSLVCLNPTLPASIASVVNDLNNMHRIIHLKRKLMWQWDQCIVEIKSNCFDRTYIFESNMIHTAILMAFNQTDDCLSTNELLTISGLQSVDDLQLYLQQFCDLKILVKQQSDNYKLNLEYSTTMDSVNLISGLKSKKSIDENRDSKKSDVSIKDLVRCVAVRLMKSLRTCSKNDLYTKIGEEMQKFCRVQITEITKQLNWLVSRDYLEFSDNIYTYVL